MVASYSPHFGEESPLSGSNGSGTIFFGSCNLMCVFCQNYSISHLGNDPAEEITSQELAQIMLSLQAQGCHNINFVTPTHVVPQILAALPHAITKGFHLPLVYNCNGYETVQTLQLLDSIIDIYMPDFKFWKNVSAKGYTNAENYPHFARKALKEMHHQVGDLIIDTQGIAQKGLLIRHLLMPGGLDETKAILEFIAHEISSESYVNIMEQYRPCGRAEEFPELNKTLRPEEHQKAKEYAQTIGLTRLDKKDLSTLFRLLKLSK